MKYSTYVLVLSVEGVPHGGDDLGHLAETGIRVLTLYSCLGVTEEERVCRHWSGTQNTSHYQNSVCWEQYDRNGCMIYEKFLT